MAGSKSLPRYILLGAITSPSAFLKFAVIESNRFSDPASTKCQQSLPTKLETTGQSPLVKPVAVAPTCGR